MSSSEVRIEHDGGITTLILDRPQRRNAVDTELWEQLRRAIVSAAHRPPRALIICGAGGHFSAGLDLKPDNPLFARVLPLVQNQDAAAARGLVRELKAVLEQLAAFPAPTIAAVEGACIGIGLEIALACDLRVVARDAKLSLPEVRLGLVPDLGGSARLTRLLGSGRAGLMVLAARQLDGAAAQRMGLAELQAEPGAALAMARSLAADIRAGAPTAVQGALQLVRSAGDLDLAEALDLETEAGVSALLSGELIEALGARMSRREPAWDA